MLVFRTFPIRVAGTQAGPLEDEIAWETVQKESGYPHPIYEMTTVSKKLRRVARFDWNLASRSIAINRPTAIALNGLDYLSFDNEGAPCFSELSRSAREFIGRLEKVSRVPVTFCGTSPSVLFDRRDSREERSTMLACSSPSESFGGQE